RRWLGVSRLVLVAVALVAIAACSSGRGGNLGDGKHFGFVTALDPSNVRIVFDPAELLAGAAAQRAAEAAGTVVSQGGSYVRNTDHGTRRVAVDAGIVVRLLKPCCELHRVAFQDWVSGFQPDARSFYGTSKSYYEITIAHGRVVAVDEVLVS
ncbi:MAG: hypothetical protein QOI47_1306, partial [Actinomycetota bacterium]|nr:hypothetical protein [Actinomycetota bacterium]